MSSSTALEGMAPLSTVKKPIPACLLPEKWLVS